MTTISDKAKLFLELHHKLTREGFKQKDIAKKLKIYPSAYSAMVNIIFPKIAQLSSKSGSVSIEKRVSASFKLVNNVSERKVRQYIDDYLEILQNFQQQENETPQYFSATQRLQHLIQNSPVDILKELQGIYDCFYVSSFGYKVKREPFMIKLNASKQFLEVKKGNALSPATYSGFLYKTNEHLLTIQLFEDGTIHKDHFLIHLCLPPSYTDSFDFLKGISISMANSFFPISRKIILKRISQTVNYEDYEALETIFFEKEQSADHKIVKYLYENELIEYVPIPRPNYDESDLQKE